MIHQNAHTAQLDHHTAAATVIAADTDPTPDRRFHERRRRSA